MKVLTINEDVLTLYIQAMEDWCKQRNAVFNLCINSSFNEDWSSITDTNDEDIDDIEAFYEYQNKWLEDNDIDMDDLVYAFIKSGKYDKFVNTDT